MLVCERSVSFGRHLFIWENERVGNDYFNIGVNATRLTFPRFSVRLKTLFRRVFIQKDGQMLVCERSDSFEDTEKTKGSEIVTLTSV